MTTNRTLAPLERQSASAFALAGALILASLVVPIGLGALTDWAWVSGLVLIGLAVVSVSAGLAGLYPRVKDRAPTVALAGAGAATVAAVAALGVIALAGIALGSEAVQGVAVSEPMGVFALLGVSMAGGLSLGLLLFGVATWKTEGSPRTVGGLLVVGGGVLLAPVAVEVIGLPSGISAPAWLLFAAIGAVAFDTLAIGYSLRS